MIALETARATPRLRIRRIARRAFSTALLAELHAMSNRLIVEDLEHFCDHAMTNEVVHVFERADTQAIVGFQFWKTAPIALPRARAIVGGKLRVAPEFRGRALRGLLVPVLAAKPGLAGLLSAPVTSERPGT